MTEDKHRDGHTFTILFTKEPQTFDAFRDFS